MNEQIKNTDTTEIIKKIQEERKGRKLITYITSTRPNLSAPIADDAVRIIYDHLEMLFDKNNREKLLIDLFLYTSGGEGVVPWRLVNLIREFAKSFEVLIPYKAYSAGTSICLGADKIIMHPMGELGPVDPSVANEFNPVTKEGRQIRINVEDVTAYVNFIKDSGIKHEDELVQAFKCLSDKVHPLALGNVHRFYSQSRMIGKKILKLHMSDEHKIKEIVENLTTKLYYHGHPINRKEAKEYGLKVVEPGKNTEKLMWNLYKKYEEELEMRNPFHPVQIFSQAQAQQQEPYTSYKTKIAMIESEGKSNSFGITFNLIKNQQEQIIPIPVQQGWE